MQEPFCSDASGSTSTLCLIQKQPTPKPPKKDDQLEEENTPQCDFTRVVTWNILFMATRNPVFTHQLRLVSDICPLFTRGFYQPSKPWLAQPGISEPPKNRPSETHGNKPPKSQGEKHEFRGWIRERGFWTGIFAAATFEKTTYRKQVGISCHELDKSFGIRWIQNFHGTTFFLCDFWWCEWRQLKKNYRFFWFEIGG